MYIYVCMYVYIYSIHVYIYCIAIEHVNMYNVYMPHVYIYVYICIGCFHLTSSALGFVMQYTTEVGRLIRSESAMFVRQGHLLLP